MQSTWFMQLSLRLSNSNTQPLLLLVVDYRLSKLHLQRFVVQ
jgi:hypothetical protein